MIIVKQRYRRMMLDREIFVRHADEHPGGDPTQLANKEDLIFMTPKVLQNCVRSCNSKSSVCER